MKFPTWDDVGVPHSIVNSIRQMKACPLLDSVIHQIVWHSHKKLSPRYRCASCQYNHEPDRPSEQLSLCPSCSSPFLRLKQSWERHEKIPVFTRGNPVYPSDLSPLFAVMSGNYERYFGETSDDVWQWGYQKGRFWVEFLGGTKAFAERPKVAAYKSALLTPFLWDTSFAWSSDSGWVGDGFICHILTQWDAKEQRDEEFAYA